TTTTRFILTNGNCTWQISLSRKTFIGCHSFANAAVELVPRIRYFLPIMTLTEKLLARASGKAKVEAGDNIWVNADVLMTHDDCGPGTNGVFKREFGKTAKVWDKNEIVIIPDHYIFTADSKSNRNVDILREFVQEQDLPY